MYPCEHRGEFSSAPWLPHSCWTVAVASQTVVFKLMSSTPKQIFFFFLAVVPQLLVAQFLQQHVNSVQMTSVSGISLSWSHKGIHFFLLEPANWTEQQHQCLYFLIYSTPTPHSDQVRVPWFSSKYVHSVAAATFSEATNGHNHFLCDLVKHSQLQYWDSLYWACSSVINILPFRGNI